MPNLYDMPHGDPGGYPAASTIVTCRIVDRGRLAALSDCVSPLADPRGPWLARQLMRKARVVDKEWNHCPLIGRSIRFQFSFSDDEMTVSTPRGPKNEPPPDQLPPTE